MPTSDNSLDSEDDGYGGEDDPFNLYHTGLNRMRNKVFGDKVRTNPVKMRCRKSGT